LKTLAYIAISVAIIFTVFSPTYAQWVRPNGSFKARVYSLAVSGTILFAGTNGAGVFRRPLSEMITSARAASGELPGVFRLEQNYPNPFNPSTVISYQLPAVSHVTLKAYDILGREVATLVNERQYAGAHVVHFDGSTLASGVYFYRITINGNEACKKMVLMR
jgi:hypothetical protein